jgi:NADP-dependent 3-hydroxy acid dehydrogenase YdfG
MQIERRVLVTGASSGIGRDTAVKLSQLGWIVFGAARRTQMLETLRAEAGEHFHPIHLDVNDAASIARAADEIHARTAGYGVDAVVNNAGIAIAGALAEATDDDLRAQFETNVFGLMAVTRALLPNMIKRRSGRIVNVSSSGGLMSLPFVGGYHATKFAVEALSDALRWELSPFDVRVSLIEPGPIRTEFADKLVAATKTRNGEASVYHPVLARADAIKAWAERRMQGPEVVTRDIVHALTAAAPSSVLPATSSRARDRAVPVHAYAHQRLDRDEDDRPHTATAGRLTSGDAHVAERVITERRWPGTPAVGRRLVLGAVSTSSCASATPSAWEPRACQA